MLTDDQRGALERACAEAVAWRAHDHERTPAAGADYATQLARFDAPLPLQGTPSDEVIATLARDAAPGLMGMTHPRFFAWVIGASHPAGVAADWLAAAWGQNVGSEVMASAAAVETVSARWLLELLDLPRGSSVGFVTGATMANFTGLAAARASLLARTGWDVEADGLFGAPPVDVLIGADAHSTVFAALRYLGFGERRVRLVATDDQGRMRPDALAAALAAGSGPRLVIAQAGQINTGAIDPVTEVAALARRHDAWLHVDGAFGLWARACPETRSLAEGLELADSWATDGHKWLQVPYDCGYVIVRDPAAHRRAMGLEAAYLPVARGEHRNPRDFVPELSRRARGFATWAVIRALGREGIAEMIARHSACARRMAERLAATAGVSVVNEVTLNQVIARFGADLGDEVADRLTAAVVERVQASGVCMLGGSEWRGRQVLRVSVCGGPTTSTDMDLSADAVLDAWGAVRDEARRAS